MSKTVKQNLFEMTLQVINWDQYFNAIIRERAYQTVEEYTVQQSYGVPSSEDLNSPPKQEDATYRRDYVIVEELEDPSKVVRKQLMEQLEKAGVMYQEFSSDFQGSVEEAVIHAVENFTEVETCAVVYLNEHHGYKHWMLAPTTREDLILRLLSYSQGALVVYRPRMFTLFKVKV